MKEIRRKIRERRSQRELRSMYSPYDDFEDSLLRGNLRRRRSLSVSSVLLNQEDDQHYHQYGGLESDPLLQRVVPESTRRSRAFSNNLRGHNDEKHQSDPLSRDLTRDETLTSLADAIRAAEIEADEAYRYALYQEW